MKYPTQHHVRFLEQMLPVRSDNELIVVLTGHLLVEELLVAVVEKQFPNPKNLNCRGFNDYLSLAKALARPELSGVILDEVEALNRLRNQLAHNLDEAKYRERRAKFLSFCTEPCPDAVRAECGEMWFAIRRLHSRLIFALEYDLSSLRLPSLLSMAGKEEPNQRPERNAGAASPSTSESTPGVAHP